MVGFGSFNFFINPYVPVILFFWQLWPMIDANFKHEGPGLGAACDYEIYSKFVKPIQQANTDAMLNQANFFYRRNVTRNNLTHLSCHGSVTLLRTGKVYPKYYRCDRRTKKCVCNDEEPLAQERNLSHPTGCSSKKSKPGDPCDFEFATLVEENYFSKIYGNKTIRGKKTTKFDIAYYHVENSKFWNKYINRMFSAINMRRLCLGKKSRTMQCNSNQQCECLNDGLSFKYKQVGDDCVGEANTVCMIQFLGNHTHQDVACDRKKPCDIAKNFFVDNLKNVTDENFVVKACGGLWGKVDDLGGGGWKMSCNNCLQLYASLLITCILFN